MSVPDDAVFLRAVWAVYSAAMYYLLSAERRGGGGSRGGGMKSSVPTWNHYCFSHRGGRLGE